MNLLVLPVDGLAPVVRLVRKAKKSVRVTIFRCDLREIEKALGDAVARGVSVHALIAQNNRSGEKALRKLELRLLGAGVTVSRTADDLVRYHNKMLIIDERVLCVFGFNFTRLELSKRRSMGIVTRQRTLVNEALKLFEADATRQSFTSAAPNLVISPINSRARLEKLINRAKTSQAIDGPMLRLLKKKVDEGVEVRIIGKAGRLGSALRVALLPELRVHIRAILRDDAELFLGSQGLRTIELDRRREVGIVLRDRSAIKRFRSVFEEDWASTKAADGDSEKKAA
jgi:phosphatidylserine/phosphatidylglycerophosphate/cardiolipin synthase-like enzyme